MNIKQAETLSGVSRQNIRFYEREGLITPDRNPENDYREYHEEHIETLKQIRALRMVDMPLDSIRQLLRGSCTMQEAASVQEKALAARAEELQIAIRFCRELRGVECLEKLDVDTLLSRMEQPENKKGLFAQWLEDYRKVSLAEHEKVFTFIPQDAVTTAREFTAALFAYANQNNLDLVVTREGMYPEFSINGIEYTAQRLYTHVHGIPVASIRCSVKYPEDFEPDVPAGRKRYMKLLNLGWIVIPYGILMAVLIISLQSGEPLALWEICALAVMFVSLVFMTLYRFGWFHFNENGRK